jgi:hypothetical protein
LQSVVFQLIMSTEMTTMNWNLLMVKKMTSIVWNLFKYSLGNHNKWQCNKGLLSSQCQSGVGPAVGKTKRRTRKVGGRRR